MITTRYLRGMAILLSAALCAAATPLRGQDLHEILERFDRVQDSIHTLSADFTETTESELLTEPIRARGRVFLTKPDSVRWEYSSPEEMRFVICRDEYTGYFPARKRAEKRDIRRWSEQLFRFLGLGQTSDELSEFYEIRLEDPGPKMQGSILLVLDPKKRRVRKRMDSVHFWIDGRTYLPVRVEYRSKRGDRRVIEFKKMSVNPALAANLYKMELPPDVHVTRGFSALSGFSSSAND